MIHALALFYSHHLTYRRLNLPGPMLPLDITADAPAFGGRMFYMD